MKTITNFAIALFMGCTFIACQKADDGIIGKKEVHPKFAVILWPKLIQM